MRAFLSRYASLWAFVLVLLLWEIAARAFQLPVYVLPAPSAIASAARELGVERWLEHLLATLEVAISGYLVAIAIALPLAVGSHQVAAAVAHACCRGWW